MAGWLADNPLKGLGGVLAASIGAEIIKANMGSLFQQALQNSMMSGGAGGGPQINLATAKFTVAGSIAIAAVAAAADQAEKLDKQLGTSGQKGSIFGMFVGADEKGNFSLKQFGKDAGSAVIDPSLLVGDKVGAAIEFLKQLTGGYEQKFDEDAKAEARKRDQVDADAAIKANAELEAQLARLGEAADSTAQKLAKIDPSFAGSGSLNRGNAPSPVKP